ncbi:MAG: hypothetical protein Q9180_009042 [Flavoplaca navasiana]
MFGAEFLASLQDEMAQMEKRNFKLPFDAFPQEIKTHIISYLSLDIRDLKNVRLVSHNLAETAAHFLFSELRITPWTLGRFCDQRSLQTIYSHVRNLEIYDTILPSITRQDWTLTWASSWDARLPSEVSTPFEQYDGISEALEEQNIRRTLGSFDLFKRLVGIKLDLQFDTSHLELDASLILVGECLSAAKHLEDLHLEVSWRGMTPRADCNLDFLANISLSTRRLKKLRLDGVWTRISSLQRLLFEHQNMLEILDLDCVKLCNSGLATPNDDLSVTFRTLSTQLHIDRMFVHFEPENMWDPECWYSCCGVSLNCWEDDVCPAWGPFRTQAQDIKDFFDRLYNIIATGRYKQPIMTILSLKAFSSTSVPLLDHGSMA